MDWDILRQLVARRFKGLSSDEVKEIYRRTPDLYNDFREIGDKLVLNGYEKDDYYIYLQEKVQKDKPFYIPSRREIEEHWDKGCAFSSSSYQSMYRFLRKTFGCSDKVAELKLMEFYNAINFGERLQEVLDRLQDDSINGEDGFVFNSQDEFAEFARLYMNMNNHSHIMVNRGYTANDLFNAMGGFRGLPKDMTIAPGSPEAADMLNEVGGELEKRGIKLDEERMKAELAGERRSKIGRNEPCPCGSGKKYKNCCGK